MSKMTKKDKILLILSAVILVAVAVFLIFFWDSVYSIAVKLLNGADVVEEYIQELGITGMIVIMLLLILCFFVPVIPSLPIQIACGLGYGILWGSIVSWVAFMIATQLFYLFRQNLQSFSSPKQLAKRQEMEALIKDSNRSLYFALFVAYCIPALPFLVISNLAMSGLKHWKYTLTTSVGMLPNVIITIFLGEKLLSSSPVASVITLVVIIALIVLSMTFNEKLIKWIFTRKKKKEDEKKEEE